MCCGIQPMGRKHCVHKFMFTTGLWLDVPELNMATFVAMLRTQKLDAYSGKTKSPRKECDSAVLMRTSTI